MDYAKVRFLIASRIYQDMLSFIERILQIRISLTSDPEMTALQARRFLRVNRNCNYLRQEQHFDTVAVLGAGGFGRVELVEARNNTAKRYAIKTMYVASTERRARYHRIAQVERDIAILGSDCPHVMRYKAVWTECNNGDKPDSFKFLMPVMNMGSLKTVIKQLHPYVYRNVSFTFCDMDDENMQVNATVPFHKLKMEVRALRIHEMDELFSRIYARYMMQMVTGVKFLHSHGVVHHDIKPDNFLVDDNLDLKLADYGLCSGVHYQQLYEFAYWAKPAESQHMPLPSQRADLVTLSPVSLRGRATTRRRIAKDITAAGGTTWYRAPEQFDEWYETPGRENREFPSYRHYPLDWYAIGMTLFDLVTGSDIFALSMRDFPNCSPLENEDGALIRKTDRATWLKIHEEKIPFFDMELRDQLDLDNTFVDMRFFKIIRKLLRIDPYLRLGDLDINDDDDILSLSEGVPLTGNAEWHFNDFYADEFEHPMARRIRKYTEEGAPEIDPNTATIPEISSFPFMTGSPEVIPHPTMSPTKKMRSRQNQ